MDMSQAQIEEALAGLEREDRSWDGEEARAKRQDERRRLIARALEDPAIETLTMERGPGRLEPSRRWRTETEPGVHPVAIVAIECGVDAATLTEGLRSRPMRAHARAADGETVWEALRRTGHADEAAVMAALQATDPDGAGTCRAPVDGRGVPWPRARIALWRDAGAAPEALEALRGWDPGESAPERWAEVERGLGDADALLAALGAWNTAHGASTSETHAAHALGEAIARTCERASTAALEGLAGRIAERKRPQDGPHRTLEPSTTPWAHTGGAQVLGPARAGSPRLRAVLDAHPEWARAWRDAGEAELARTVRMRSRRWRDDARASAEDAETVALLEGVLALGVAVDGQLRPGERDSARWRPVLAIALDANAPPATLARLIAAGADASTPDSEGANAWHVLMRRPERVDEDAVVATLAKHAAPGAITARNARGHRPEDVAGAWGGGTWDRERIARYRAAGAAFDAATVLRTKATDEDDDPSDAHAARWRLATEGPGGAQAALAECAGERTKAWLWTSEGQAGMRALGAAIAETAHRAGVAPEAFLEPLGAQDGEGLAHAGTTLVAGVLAAWPALAQALHADPEALARLATRTAHAARGRRGEEALWLEVLLSASAARALDTAALAKIAGECARGGWGRALARAGEVLAERGQAETALEVAAGPSGGAMTEALLKSPAMRAWLAGEGARAKGTPSAVAIAFRGYSGEGAEACRRAGAALDAGAVIDLLGLAANGAMDARAMRWMGKHMGKAIEEARPSAVLMRRLVARGRRDALSLLAKAGHARRVRRAAAQAAEHADGNEGVWALALMAELGGAQMLAPAARRALEKTPNGAGPVALVPSKLAAECGVGVAWGLEGMVAERGDVAHCLNVRAMGAEEARLRGTEIDAARALGTGQSAPEALAGALAAQGWTPERARKVVAVRPGAGRDPEEARLLASALGALGARRKERASRRECA